MPNHFKPDVGHGVSKKEALDWIRRYDEEHRKEKDKDTRSVFYGKDIIQHLLNQDGCTGITFFLGLKHSDHAKRETVQLVLVGTKEDGTLIWPDAAGKDGNGGAVNNGTTCPPYCPSNPTTN
jgi:hypothetical protein